MEKTKLLDDPKIAPLNNKEKVGDKIESLWAENSFLSKNHNKETKKLLIKLETTGREKRKIILKMESASSKTNASNFYLISELLKEFFNGTSNFE